MKKAVIFIAEGEDRNYYIFYDKHGQCRGANFHHGCGLNSEVMDNDYLKPCPDMSPIYFDHLRDLAKDEVITDKTIMKALQSSAQQYLITYNEHERVNIIEEQIEINIGVLFERVADRCYSRSKDISPAQNTVIEEAKELLKVLLVDFTNKNQPKSKR